MLKNLSPESSKGKNKTYKNDAVEFYKGGIESKTNYSFIPFASITHIYLGELPPTTALNSKNLLIGAVAGIVGLFFIFAIGKWYGILLGLVAIIGGIYFLLNSTKSTKWYALNIEMASSAVYSFVADNKDFVDLGYKLLLQAINEREENRKEGTYYFLNGKFEKCAVGDNAKTINNE